MHGCKYAVELRNGNRHENTLTLPGFLTVKPDRQAIPGGVVGRDSPTALDRDAVDHARVQALRQRLPRNGRCRVNRITRDQIPINIHVAISGT